MPKLVAHVAKRYGDKPFCASEDGTTVSFAEFERRVSSLGAQLIALGVAPGDRVAIWAPNSPEWIIAATATQCIGAVMVPINTRFKGREARYVLERTCATALFTVGGFLDLDFLAILAEATGGPTFEQLPALRHALRLDEPSFAVAQAAIPRSYARAAADVTSATTADILFTSGTTGHPKGAMHGHGQALLMAATYNTFNDLRDSDRVIVVNPFFHSFGYRAGWVSALAAGMTVWPMAAFDAGAVLRLIERERITVLAGAPAVFHSLLNHPEFAMRDISSLRSGHTGGAKTPPEIVRAGYERFGFDIFLTSYGQTESTALIASNRPGDPIEVLQRSVGRPVPGMAVRIIDEVGRDAARGELLVRGPLVMQGYFGDPAATAATIDPDGWLHTGDVASIDAEGRLNILDRMKDVVITGGFNAYPVEIELMLAEYPSIAEVAVVGIPDVRMGEVCAACVVLKPGTMLSLDELTSWARPRMANYKVPRRLLVLDDFPRTPLGKVQKFKLVEMLQP